MTGLQNYINSFSEIRKDFNEKINKLYEVIISEKRFISGTLHKNSNKYCDLRWFPGTVEYNLTPEDGIIKLTWKDYDSEYNYDLPYEFFEDFENYIKNLENSINENNEKAEKEFEEYKKSNEKVINSQEYQEFLKLQEKFKNVKK